MVGWLGDRAGQRARRRLSGGSRWNPCSGEQAIRSEQRMGGQALVVRGEELGVLRRHLNGAEPGARQGGANGDGGGGVSREGEHDSRGSRRRCVGIKLTRGHGMGAVWPMGLGDVHRPTGQLREAVAPPACAGAARGIGLRLGARHPYPATVHAARASDQRSVHGLGVRVWWRADAAGRDIAHTRVWARSGANLFQGSTVDHGVSHDFETEVVQVVNRKVVDLIPLYNFCKGRMVLLNHFCTKGMPRCRFSGR
jgi:hypothetical protein